MELRLILEILFRRKWIVINIFLAIFLTIFVGTLLIQPWYTATSKVFLQRSTASSTLLSSLGLQGGNVAPQSYSDTDRADYLALAQVAPVVDKVIEQEHITRERTSAILMRKIFFLKPILRFFGVDVENTRKVMNAEDLINRSLLSYLFPRPYVNIDQYQTTDLISFEAMETDREKASKIANAMAKAFVENEVNRIREDYKGAKEYIQNNISAYNGEYRKSLRTMREFKEREKTVSLDSEVTEYIKQVSDLKQSQRDLYVQLADTKTKYNSNHPAVIDIQNKIEETKKQIKQKMGRVFGADNISSDPALRNPTKKPTEHPDSAVRKAQKGALPKDPNKFDDETLITQLPKKSYELAQITLAVAVTQDIYNSLLKYNYQVGIAESIAVANVYVVENAKTPEVDDSRHKRPKVWLNTAIAALLGMVFGIGGALLVEYLDDTIKTAHDLKVLKAAPLLGSIARLKKKDLKLIDEVEPTSPLREAFRTIRNSIRFATLDKPSKSLLVTSSIQGEGKSFVAANIAISAVGEGKRVLLIDGDMRKPVIHSYFGLDNSVGLTNCLVGEVDLESIQRQTRVSGLRVITTGPIPPDPAKLVESGKMRQLLEDMKSAYDLVIIDSPPVLAASDALILGGWADSTIVIVESGTTNKKLFLHVQESLLKANVSVAGVVLNKEVRHKGSYYYHHYRA